MTATRENAAGAGWRKLAALLLALAAVGLPVNDVGSYALLLVLAVVIFSGEVSAQGARLAGRGRHRRRRHRRAMAAGAAAHRRGP